jgi:ClpP class serine protease
LLATRGVSIGENEAVGAELLDEIMELREALDDARDDAAATSQVNQQVGARLAAAMTELAHALDDERDDQRAKQAAIAARYYDRMLQAGPVGMERSL